MTGSVVVPDLNLPANENDGSPVTYSRLRKKKKERCLDEIGQSIDGMWQNCLNIVKQLVI
jgi:hypothetical protein